MIFQKLVKFENQKFAKLQSTLSSADHQQAAPPSSLLQQATQHSLPALMFEQTRGVKRGREQDSDPTLDRHGNAATPKLFINKLPHNITEQEISDLFVKLDGFISVQLGNKILMAVCFHSSLDTFDYHSMIRLILLYLPPPMDGYE